MGMRLISFALFLTAAIWWPFQTVTATSAASQASSLVEWIGANRSGKVPRTSHDMQRGQELLRAHAARIAWLMREDPARALAEALSAADRATLPLAWQAMVEERIAANGDFEIYCVTPHDRSTHNPGELRRQVKLGGRYYPVILLSNDQDYRTSYGVRISGLLHQGQFLLEELGASTTGSSRFATPTGGHPVELDAYRATGNRTALVIRVDFGDLPGEPSSDAEMAAEMSQVREFLAAASLQQLDLTYTGTPTYRMPETGHYYAYQSGDGPGELMTAARSAASAGYNLDQYDFDIVLFRDVGFNFSGLGVVGGKGVWVQIGSGTGWVGTATHELGHNLGLYHAKAWDPDDLDPLGDGHLIEYGNPFDNMGAGGPPEAIFSGNYQRILGWLGGSEVATASSSGTYTVTQMDAGLAKIAGRAYSLKIPTGKFFNGLTLDYWVDFRRLFPAVQEVDNGVALQLGDEAGANGASLLLDLAPDTATMQDAGLELGRTFADPDASIFITPVGYRYVGTTAEAIDVVVQRGPFPGNQNPTGTLSGPASCRVWQPVVWTAQASDPNGDELAYYWDVQDGTRNSNTARRTDYFSTSATVQAAVTVSDLKGGSSQLSSSLTVVDPLDNITSLAAPGSGPLNVYYFNGQFRVLNGAEMRSSPDGTNWTAAAIGQKRAAGWTGNQHLLQLQQGGGVYAIAGYDHDGTQWVGHLQTSPDLITWTARDPMVNQELRSVAYSNGVWVAVGDQGVITRSVNGGTVWAAVAGGTTDNLTHVLGTPAGFLVCKDDPDLLYSTNGLDWSVLTTPWTYGSQSAITLVDGQILVTCAYLALRVQWTVGQAPVIVGSASLNHYLRGCWQENGLLYSVGTRSGGGQWPEFLYRSRDGLTWVEKSLPANADGLSTVAANGARLVTAGNGIIYLSDLLYDQRDQWLIANFPGEERFEAALAAPEADPDGDGYSNLLEMALGTNPRSPVTPRLYAAAGALSLPDGLGGQLRYLTFSFRRLNNAAALGLVYLPEISTNLSQWDSDAGQFVTVSTTDNGDGTSTVVVRSAAPLTGSVPQAIRLRVHD